MSLPFQDIAEVAKAIGGIITTLIIAWETYEKFKTKKKPLKRKRHRQKRPVPPSQEVIPNSSA